jgi:hypothetical protein
MQNKETQNKETSQTDAERIEAQRIASLLKYLEILNDLNRNGVKVYEEIKRTIKALENVLKIN